MFHLVFKEEKPFFIQMNMRSELSAANLPIRPADKNERFPPLILRSEFGCCWKGFDFFQQAKG